MIGIGKLRGRSSAVLCYTNNFGKILQHDFERREKERDDD
jgi:hypothetical protein